MDGFKKFLLRGNVVDLAVGVVIGAAFGTVVTALVKGIVTPLIGLIFGSPDLAALNLEAGGQNFLVGDFLNAVIAFVLVALVVYFLVVVPMNRLLDRFKPAPTPPAPTRECPECLSKIPARARRCAFCTAVLPAHGATPLTNPAPASPGG